MIAKEELIRRIKGYVERVKHPGPYEDGKFYPLKEEGLWRIFGGTTGNGSASGLCSGGRYEIKNDLVQGRFIEAIAYAVQQENFAGWYCSLDDMSLFQHGYVKKAEPLKPKIKNLGKDFTLERLADIIEAESSL